MFGGVLFDNNYNHISVERLYTQIEDKDFIIKPAHDSSMGRGVKLIRRGSEEDIKKLISSYHSNFIIQKVVNQSEFTKSLNPTSLNCMRITTLNINNRISAENQTIKIGAVGQSVDNIGSGSGGMIIGVNHQGALGGFVLKVDGTLMDKKHDGQPFGGILIPNFDQVIEFAVNCHSMVPNMGVVGWDIALDHNDKPVLIKANTFWPGITIEQLASGPIFGNRTEELIEFVTKARPSTPPFFCK